jgi:general secretion pathway protein D
VTIAEVRLNQSLSHGVSWFFQAGHHGIGSSAADAGGGFAYTFGVPNAKVALEALESVTKVEITAAPALTVLDNQTAMLKVGDQVPIQTRSSQSVATADAPVVSDIALKDTGIILKVTPRINASGLVMLDIDQEDSDVVPTTSSAINSPTIRQRQVNSSVAVQSGAEIVLGGIITRQKERSQAGLPFLNAVPVLGSALATSAQDVDGRTELLIILRPTIMANQEEVAAVTQEIKRRMRSP